MAEARVEVASEAESSVALTGGVLEIRVAENATTGYRWTVSAAGGEQLGPQAGDWESPAAPAPGAGGRRTFRFRVPEGAGGRFELTLERPWEPGRARDRLVVRVA